MTADARGLSQSVQYAILTPVLLLTVLGIIQGGVWFHGRHAAAEAAAVAADEARGRNADLTTATDAARRVTDVAGLSDVTVTIDRGPARVRVVVGAAAPAFLDLPLPRIQQRASAPVERVTRP